MKIRRDLLPALAAAALALLVGCATPGRGSHAPTEAQPGPVLEELARAVESDDLEAAVALYLPHLRPYAARELDGFTADRIAALRRVAREDRREPLPPEQEAGIRAELGADEVALFRFAPKGKRRLVLLARVAARWYVVDVD